MKTRLRFCSSKYKASTICTLLCVLKQCLLLTGTTNVGGMRMTPWIGTPCPRPLVLLREIALSCLGMTCSPILKCCRAPCSEKQQVQHLRDSMSDMILSSRSSQSGKLKLTFMKWKQDKTEMLEEQSVSSIWNSEDGDGLGSWRIQTLASIHMNQHISMTRNS